MSISSAEFWSRLVEIGLMTQADCSNHAATLAKQLGVPLSELPPQKFAEHLLRQKRVTRFQASALLADAKPDLRIGNYIARDDKPLRPLSHWLPAQTRNSEGESKKGFLLRAPLSQLTESVRACLAISAELNAPTLQQVELSGGAEGGDQEQTVEIFSSLPEGAPLCNVLKSRKSLSPRKVVRLGVDLAAALQAIHKCEALDHARGFNTHGAVSSDHVWITPKGHGLLLRDPSSPPRHPKSDWSTSWIERIDHPAQHAAPELIRSDVPPTPQSDLYSLGSLLLSLLIGRNAFEGSTHDELFQAHNESYPEQIVTATEQGASGDPLMRVLAFALAKDPTSRFSSAEQFSQALLRAGESLEAGASGSAIESETDSQSIEKAEPTSKKQKDLSTAKRSTNKLNASREASVSDATSAPASPKPVERKTTTPKPEKAAPAQSQSPPAVPDAIPDVATPLLKTATPKPPVGKPEAVEAAKALPVAVEAGERDAGVVPEERSASENATTTRKRRRRKKNRLPFLLGMMVAPLLMLGIAIALRGRGPTARPRPAPSLADLDRIASANKSVRDVVPKEQPKSAEPSTTKGFELVESDRLIWVPPYAADSASPPLELMPPGPAAIVTIQMERFLTSDSTASIREAFDPEVTALVGEMTQRTGIAADQVRRCTVSLFPGKDGWPETALAIELNDPVALKTLLEGWDAGRSPLPDGSTIYVGDESDSEAYFIAGGDRGKLDSDGEVTRFAVGSVDRMREVAEIDGNAIPLARGLQTLWNESSEASDLVVLVTPNFLFADGRRLVTDTLPELTESLKRWLIPDVAAFSINTAFEPERTYVELRQLPSGTTKTASLLQSLRQSIDGWPGWADDFIVQSVADPTWRLLANRLPMMMRFAKRQTRSTQIGETVVASMYLPNEAAAQLSLATALALNTPPGGDAIASTEPTETLSVDDMLDRPMSISFLQLSLQFAVDAVNEEFQQSLPSGTTPPGMRIIGADLELNGITQNQQIRGFDREDVPLRTILTELVMAANPDKTASGPDDLKQSLVWVIHPVGQPPEQTEILITTRDAAEGKYELPNEFVARD
ncbi:MAG: hypothetical protein AAF802_09545 [Planctomycetota bacterium]